MTTIDTKAVAAIIERLEAGEVGRDIDARVAVALAWGVPTPEDDRPWLKMPTRYDECAPGTYWLVQRSGMSLRTAPEFTTSLDVVTALQERVLPEWILNGLWQIRMTLDAGVPPRALHWACYLRPDGGAQGDLRAEAPTEPAARLAAVLKAVMATHDKQQSEG